MQDGLFRASKRPVLRFKTAHVALRPLHRGGGGAAMPGVRMFSFTSIHSEYALPYCFTPAFIMMRCVVWLSRWCCSEPFFPKAERRLLRSRQASFTLLSCTIDIGVLQVVACRQACIAVHALLCWPLAFGRWRDCGSRGGIGGRHTAVCPVGRHACDRMFSALLQPCFCKRQCLRGGPHCQQATAPGISLDGSRHAGCLAISLRDMWPSGIAVLFSCLSCGPSMPRVHSLAAVM